MYLLVSLGEDCILRSKTHTCKHVIAMQMLPASIECPLDRARVRGYGQIWLWGQFPLVAGPVTVSLRFFYNIYMYVPLFCCLCLLPKDLYFYTFHRRFDYDCHWRIQKLREGGARPHALAQSGQATPTFRPRLFEILGSFCGVVFLKYLRIPDIFAYSRM